MRPVVDFVPYSDRTAIKAQSVDLNIIQVYVPTADAVLERCNGVTEIKQEARS